MWGPFPAATPPVFIPLDLYEAAVLASHCPVKASPSPSTAAAAVHAMSWDPFD